MPRTANTIGQVLKMLPDEERKQVEHYRKMAREGHGGICPDCKRNMMLCEGCDYSHIYHMRRGRLTYTKRQRADIWGCDCGARTGYHHSGCDCERCPMCRGQLISCGCDIIGVAKPTSAKPISHDVDPTLKRKRG